MSTSTVALPYQAASQSASTQQQIRRSSAAKQVETRPEQTLALSCLLQL
jgi:hypothetical protein